MYVFICKILVAAAATGTAGYKQVELGLGLLYWYN